MTDGATPVPIVVGPKIFTFGGRLNAYKSEIEYVEVEDAGVDIASYGGDDLILRRMKQRRSRASKLREKASVALNGYLQSQIGQAVGVLVESETGNGHRAHFAAVRPAVSATQDMMLLAA
jgi:hypothetical protein